MNNLNRGNLNAAEAIPVAGGKSEAAPKSAPTFRVFVEHVARARVRAAYDASKANYEPGNERAIGAVKKDHQDSPPARGTVANIISRAKTRRGASDFLA